MRYTSLRAFNAPAKRPPTHSFLVDYLAQVENRKNEPTLSDGGFYQQFCGLFFRFWKSINK